MCAGTGSCFPTASLSLSSECVFICVCVFDGRLCLHGKWEGAAGMWPEGKESAQLPRFSPKQRRERERELKRVDSEGHCAVWVRCASYCEEQHAALVNGFAGEEAEIVFPEPTARSHLET
ncbi:hypothetical protein QQF64_004169 [Cirrhinus molitorella]|uniref:Uncharacterized protein n=1 Tax=Cirrhinus molitorella TaxID=172907 RepID=A0ABR3MIM3_9TELE